jgi:hypothetical protein
MLTTAVALLLAGCGGGGGAAGSPHPAAGSREPPRAGRQPGAAQLVFFQRQGEGGATQDTVAVHRDGTARVEFRHGGAGGRFKDVVLKEATLPVLRRSLRRLPRRSLDRGKPPTGTDQYILRYDGRTLIGVQGAIAPRARAAVRLLDGYIDGVGIARVVHETKTHAR